MGRGNASVEIIDETGKINVNLAPNYLFYNLLIAVGLDEQEADIITDSIEDWRDRDDLHRLNGAESDYYQSLPEPHLAKNGPLDVPEEEIENLPLFTRSSKLRPPSLNCSDN